MAKRSMDIAHPKYDPELKPVEEPETIVAPKKTTEKNYRPQRQAAPPKRDVFWPVYLIGIVIVAILAFFAVRAGAKLVDTWMDLQPSSVGESTVPAANQESDQAGTAANSPDTKVNEAITTEASPPIEEAAVVTPSIDKAALKIKILNGSGVSGAASAAQTTLEAAGFKVEATGNAKKFNYDSSLVYYVSGKQAEAELVATALKDQYNITTEENDVAAGYDSLVVIGKK